MVGDEKEDDYMMERGGMSGVYERNFSWREKEIKGLKLEV